MEDSGRNSAKIKKVVKMTSGGRISKVARTCRFGT
jgi:hypothetical protein